MGISYFSAMAFTAVNRSGNSFPCRCSPPGGRKQNVFSLGQAQPLMYVRRFNGRQVGVEHLRHGRAGDVHPLFRQAALMKILPGVLGVGQIHIGDDVHNPAVGLLGQALILAPVARLHVKNGMCSRLAEMADRQELVSPRISTASGLMAFISL